MVRLTFPAIPEIGHKRGIAWGFVSWPQEGAFPDTEKHREASASKGLSRFPRFPKHPETGMPGLPAIPATPIGGRELRERETGMPFTGTTKEPKHD